MVEASATHSRFSHFVHLEHLVSFPPMPRLNDQHSRASQARVSGSLRRAASCPAAEPTPSAESSVEEHMEEYFLEKIRIYQAESLRLVETLRAEASEAHASLIEALTRNKELTMRTKELIAQNTLYKNRLRKQNLPSTNTDA